jgi:limonene 1,2-monooxygenase
MTRGRAMLGVGPGALTSDAYMMGIQAETQRPRMAESLEAIMALFRGETVTMKTDWFTLQEARLQLAPYSYPHMEVAVASTFSPAGPVAAGTNGVGVLSVSAFQPGGIIQLSKVWEMTEDAAAKAGKTVDRKDWRLVIPIHLADSREEAIRDVAEASYHFNTSYFEETLGRPTAGEDEAKIEAAIKRGGAIVGTPDDAIEAIEQLFELSGGFGGLLGMAHEWAPWEKTLHSYELLARYVAPRFQGQIGPVSDSREWVSANRKTIFAAGPAAIGKAFTDAGVEIPEAMQQRLHRGQT